MDGEQIHIEGWLWKKGPSAKDKDKATAARKFKSKFKRSRTEKKRWFVLGSRTLRYFGEEGGKELGLIELSMISDIREYEGEDGLECLDMITPVRTYTLCSDSSATIEEWKEAFVLVLTGASQKHAGDADKRKKKKKKPPVAGNQRNRGGRRSMYGGKPEITEQQLIAQQRMRDVINTQAEAFSQLSEWAQKTGNVPMSCVSYLLPYELKSLPFFGAIYLHHKPPPHVDPNLHLETLAALFTPQILEDGQMLTIEGTPATHMHIVLQGSIIISKRFPHEPTAHPVYQLGQGGMVAIDPLLHRTVHLCSSESKGSTALLSVPAADFYKILSSSRSGCSDEGPSELRNALIEGKGARLAKLLRGVPLFSGVRTSTLPKCLQLFDIVGMQAGDICSGVGGGEGRNKKYGLQQMEHGDFFMLIEGELMVQLSQTGGSGGGGESSGRKDRDLKDSAPRNRGANSRHLCGTGEWFGEIDPSAEHTWNSPRQVKAVVPSVMLRASRADFAEFLRTAGHASRRVVADAISQQALSILRKALPFAGMGDSRSRKDHTTAAAKSSRVGGQSEGAAGISGHDDLLNEASRSSSAATTASERGLDIGDATVSAAGGVVSEEWAALHHLATMMRFEAVPAGTEIGRWGFAEAKRGSEKQARTVQGLRLCGDNDVPLFGVVASGEVAVTAILVGSSGSVDAASAEAPTTSGSPQDGAAPAGSVAAGPNGLLLYTLQEADVMSTAPIGFGSNTQASANTTSNLANAFAQHRSSSVGTLLTAGAVETALEPPPGQAPNFSRSATTPAATQQPGIGSR
jgi:CRP-like cAMP-binding protein